MAQCPRFLRLEDLVAWVVTAKLFGVLGFED